MTLRHMTRVKVIKTDNNKLYVIPYDMADKFIELKGEEFDKVFEDYRIDHIKDIELYVPQSGLYSSFVVDSKVKLADLIQNPIGS